MGIVDSFLDSCIHDVASFVDQNLGFDQLFNVVKKKLELQLQEHVGLYLKERVAPSLFVLLDREIENLNKLAEATKEVTDEEVKKETEAVRRVQLMLEEYCNAHETARAARSAASFMKRQVNELREALLKTSLEIVQMEWMHDVGLTPSYNSRITYQKFFSSDDSLYPIILNLSRPKLLETIKSAVSKLDRSIEGLQACERTSLTAEGQLERAMGWACGGPNSSAPGNSSTKTSGIPHEFHDHLMRRRQLLQEAGEKASDILRICKSILEFEVSRDGILLISGEVYHMRGGGDGRTWQQAYLNALAKLEVAYLSFTRTEQEWKLAQSSMEAASNGLYSATNELRIASLKAKSASGDLQSTVLALRDCAYEASIALSAFGRVSRGHTALTSESGSMLEEVLAITEDLHDVHGLGKEAAAIHHSLMEDLSKANSILLPLESVLSNDVAAMSDAMTSERETRMQVSPIHGQAIYQSYCLRVREACQIFKPLLPSLTFSVKGLYSMLTRLARTASLHAGNLHKALEGLGESQDVKSQGISLSRPDLAAADTTQFDDKEREDFYRSDSGSTKDDFLGVTGLSFQDKGWISPPDSVYSSSSEGGVTSGEVSLSDSLNNLAEVMGQHSYGSNQFEDDTYQSNSISFCQTDLESHSQPSAFKHMEATDSENGSIKSIINKSNVNLEVEKSQSDEAANLPVGSSQPMNKDSEVNFGVKDVVSSLNKVKIEGENTVTRVARGKNPYAISVLRRVEMKLEGRDIAENREISIAEQVDYLLKQASSVDNLCNMYEGWTPWI